MRLELAPFRVTPEEWIAVSYRSTLPRMLLSYGLLGIGLGLLVTGTMRSGSAGGGALLAIWTLGPIAFYLRTVSRVRKEKGLPWETQQVVLDDEAFQTTYESGFVARVPWAKFKKALRFSQGLLLQLEGSGQTFLPQGVLSPDAEAFVRDRMGELQIR